MGKTGRSNPPKTAISHWQVAFPSLEVASGGNAQWLMLMLTHTIRGPSTAHADAKQAKQVQDTENCKLGGSAVVTPFSLLPGRLCADARTPSLEAGRERERLR